MQYLRANFISIVTLLLVSGMAYFGSRVISNSPGMSIGGWIFGLAPVIAAVLIIAFIKLGSQAGCDLSTFFEFPRHGLNLRVLLMISLTAAVTCGFILLNPFGLTMPTFIGIIVFLIVMSVSMITKDKMVDAVGLLLIALPFATYAEFEIVKLTDFDSGWITIKVAIILFFAFIWAVFNFIVLKKNIKKERFHILILIFASATLLSAVFSADIIYSLKRWLFEITYPIVIYFILINSLKSWGDVRKFLSYLIGSVFLNLIMVMYYFVKYGSEGVDNDYVLNLGFASGVLIAEVLIMIIPIIFAFLATEKEKTRKMLYFFLIILGVTGLAVSFSRMPQISMVLGLMALFFIRATRKYVIIALVLALLVGAFHVKKLTPFYSKYYELTTFNSVIYAPSMEKRYGGWEAAAAMFQDRPLTGVGIGRFNQEYGNYGVLYYSPWARGYVPMISAHNMYINFLAETGIPGVLSLSGVLFYIILSGLGFIRRAGEKRVFAYALLLSVIMFLWNNLVSGTVFAYVKEIDKGLVFWSITAVIMSCGVIREDTDSPGSAGLLPAGYGPNV
ncbi:MAG TPA: O-antigen ligase family protein [Nitrospirae bacterium]|nr:O-Antigen ligase [bacterium BMS3Abin10]GBE39568.1 O-Antigen ligase [bacterium BMS3Bbin08]HDH50222.1 O-antigen ligase family protein [Nitrospirota bacterium]HDK82527.1 O-antigen ligase family protein [Nitrospirota bacterium]